MHKIVWFCYFFCLTHDAYGFVLLSNRVMTLPVSEANPDITFVWDGTAPEISDKGEFQGGQFAHLGDEEFMAQLLSIAVAQWNGVEGAYINIEVEQGSAEINGDDQQFSIVVGDAANLSAAAFAKPNLPTDQNTIIDCDISIAGRRSSAKSLAYTIVHELGHCLGLGHSHTNYQAIMGYSRSVRSVKLGADDRAGLIFLYPDSNYVDEAGPQELVRCAVIDPQQPRHMVWLLLFFPFILGLYNMLSATGNANTAAELHGRKSLRFWQQP